MFSNSRQDATQLFWEPENIDWRNLPIERESVCDFGFPQLRWFDDALFPEHDVVGMETALY